MVDLKANPFFLDDTACAWVHNTLAQMTLREKVAQLFCCVSAGESGEVLQKRYEDIPFGGVTFRADKAQQIKQRVDYLQSRVKIPLLVSANLENGGIGIATDGTEFASQLEVSATGDASYAYMLGDVCGAEGASVGCNYAFAPVVDIHYNWRNPIINIRTYGSNPDWVLRCASEYMRGIARHNVAVSIKHFPGDGVDERDQHLLTSVNSLPCEAWDASYGKVYRALIEQGAQTVMVGHILMPAYSRRLCPGMTDREMLPASLSPELVTGLLREELGFNGLVITDSASMTGLGCAMPRRQIPAAAINAGCDMFLFGRNLQEDFESLLEDAQQGVLPAARLDEAVARVLALKASLGLHVAVQFTSPRYKEIIGCAEFAQKARACADKAITLVKDTQGLLPVTPESHRRVWLHILGDNPAFRGGSVCRDKVIKKLEEAGFLVTYFEKEHPEQALSSEPVQALKEKYDLILYVANLVTGGNDTVNRIDWVPLACGESPQYVWDIPTMFVSLGDPYHFVDVPMIRTLINCYDNSDAVLDALLEKIIGKSAFMGKSPVDPFCGMWGADL